MIPLKTVHRPKATAVRVSSVLVVKDSIPRWCLSVLTAFFSYGSPHAGQGLVSARRSYSLRAAALSSSSDVAVGGSSLFVGPEVSSGLVGSEGGGEWAVGPEVGRFDNGAGNGSRVSRRWLQDNGTTFGVTFSKK